MREDDVGRLFSVTFSPYDITDTGCGNYMTAWMVEGTTYGESVSNRRPPGSHPDGDASGRRTPEGYVMKRTRSRRPQPAHERERERMTTTRERARMTTTRERMNACTHERARERSERIERSERSERIERIRRINRIRRMNRIRRSERMNA